MDHEARKRTAKRWIHGLFDEANFDLIGELAADGWRYRANGDVYDATTIQDFVRTLRTAMPDLNNTVEEQVVEGDVVATRGITRGTHQAALGEIGATGKSVEVPWMIFTRFENDRIVEDYEIYDEHGFLKQLGAG